MTNQNRRFGNMDDNEILELLLSKKYYTCPLLGVVFNKHAHQLKPFSSLNKYANHKFVALFGTFNGKKCRRGIALHRLIWMDKLKIVIPRNWHIHHLDNDPTNNSFKNLVCLHPEDHKKFHYDQTTEEIPF